MIPVSTRQFWTSTGSHSALLLLALFFLNQVLSFTAVWPTLYVQPNLRLSPEFIGFLVLLTAWTALLGRPARALLSCSAVLYAALVVCRYADVVVPNVLGRPVNLYWDVPELPRFVWVTAKGLPWWLSVLVVLGLVGSAWGFHKLLVRAMGVVADGLKPHARSVWLWCVLTVMSAGAVTCYLGLRSPDAPLVKAASTVVAKPILPTYVQELSKLWDILSPARAARLLPPSTVVDAALAKPAGQALAGLHGRDVHLIFLETYGAVVFDQADSAAATQATLQQLEKAIVGSGRQVVSAFYKSPTIGGASDLAHLSVLSGIDLTDSRKHDVLLTTTRPTLLKVFQHEGYDVFGLYHSVSWDWVERVFYGFDVYLSGPDLGYQGPAFGFWKIPDQFAVARVEQMYPRTSGARPRLTLFPTISSHFPFHQVPPYQPDWKRLLGPEPFDAQAAARAQAEPVHWEYMKPDYLRTINYVNTWLAGMFQQVEPRETVYVLIGDHQPTGSVSREDTPWDVPVFVVSSDTSLLEDFKARGFTAGIKPQRRQPLGGLHQLTNTLLDVFGGSGAEPKLSELHSSAFGLAELTAPAPSQTKVEPPPIGRPALAVGPLGQKAP